jgi:hypothetical protein
MKKYFLKTKNGETLAATEAYDMFNAQIIFSKIKVLPLNQLLEIFIVVEDKKRL